MKAKVFKSLVHALIGLSVSMLAACSADSFDDGQKDFVPQDAPTQLKMNFAVTMTNFDANKLTRSEAGWTWKENATVYIQFKTKTGTVPAIAKYMNVNSNYEWVPTAIEGSLPEGDGTCEVYYLEDGESSGYGSAINTSEFKPIYAAKEAQWNIAKQLLTIEATLTPMTSRLRLRGYEGMSVSLGGLQYYTGYDYRTNQFNYLTSDVSLTVEADGYTPYVYCVFADESRRELRLLNSRDGEELLYSRVFGQSVLNLGESGYVTIPTQERNNGWTATALPPTEKTITINGNGKEVSFKMKRVLAGSFLMGSDDGEESSKPSHSVRLTNNFYMGETEVTQELWYAVMGQSPNATGYPWSEDLGLDDGIAAYYVSYTDCQEFVSKLTTLAKEQGQISSSESFKFPTEAQWEFAAKGGNKSKGCKFSGSDVLGEVAWYSNNCVICQKVKTKQPNELGLYDMSGNVMEWCYDYFAASPATAQIDPAGPTIGSEGYVYRGGNWHESEEYCESTYRRRTKSSERSPLIGFRLAMLAI